MTENGLVRLHYSENNAPGKSFVHHEIPGETDTLCTDPIVSLVNEKKLLYPRPGHILECRNKIRISGTNTIVPQKRIGDSCRWVETYRLFLQKPSIPTCFVARFQFYNPIADGYLSMAALSCNGSIPRSLSPATALFSALKILAPALAEL